MKRTIFVVALVAVTAAAVARGIALWVEERRRHEAYPAAKARDLLSPARRIIQNPASVVKAFRLGPGETVLEIGPGPGYFSAEAAQAVEPGGRLICFDLQRDMLLALREHLAGTSAAVPQLVVGDAARLPFRDGALDAVFLIEMLGEVPDGERAVVEAGRVLRTGGVASFCETVNDPDYVRLPVLRRLCAAARLEPVEHRRQLLGYVARFTRASDPAGTPL